MRNLDPARRSEPHSFPLRPASDTVRRLLVGLTVLVALGTATGAPLRSQSVGGAAETITAADVTALITAAAGALNDNTLAVAVVDRSGAILGVYRRPGTTALAPDVAVSLARAAAFFSNDQAPLSSRTVRFISGIHFPAGVTNAPNAALYGIENNNRGCNLGPYNPSVLIDQPRSIVGTIGPGGGSCTFETAMSGPSVTRRQDRRRTRNSTLGPSGPPGT